MAFHSVLRRASFSIPAIGSVGTAIAGVVNVGKRHSVFRQFIPFSQFSTIPDDMLLGLVESSRSAQQSLNMNFPDEFPFWIQKYGQQQYQLRRKYQDELIEVIVGGYKVVDNTATIPLTAQIHRGSQDELVEVIGGGYKVVDNTATIPLTAQIHRGSQHLLFEIIAEPNRIDIETFTMKDTVTGHIKAFQDYLEIRGFNSSMINSLVQFQQYSEVPVGFPFHIIYKRENGDIFCGRQYEDEAITSEVSGLLDYEFQMSVEVWRGQLVSKFEINVFPNQPTPIIIHKVSMSTSFKHLEIFRNFLEIRGINLSTVNFLFDYFNCKVEQRYGRRFGVK